MSLKAIQEAKVLERRAAANGISNSLKRLRLEEAQKCFENAFNLAQYSNYHRDEAILGLMRTISAQGEVEAEYVTIHNQTTLLSLVDRLFELIHIVPAHLVYHLPPVVFSSTLAILDANVAKLDLAAQDRFWQHVQSQINHGHKGKLDCSALKTKVVGSIANLANLQANKLVDAGKHAQALNVLLMHESSFNAAIETPPSEGCLFELPNIYVELELHKQDFDVIFAVCSAKRLITSGDANWNRAIAQTPINLDYANLAQDDYRLAQLTIDQLGEMQLEVEITVKRGRFYESALELPVTAHAIYLQVIQLATSLSPALPKGPWYAHAFEAVQRHRAELAAKETREHHQWREAVKAHLKDDFDKLEAADKLYKYLDWEFAKFVWKEWPPKTEGAAEIGPEGEEGMKKRYPKIIARYHVDKNSGFGDDWKVLSEEINKLLSERYNGMKGL